MTTRRSPSSGVSTPEAPSPLRRCGNPHCREWIMPARAEAPGTCHSCGWQPSEG